MKPSVVQGQLSRSSIALTILCGAVLIFGAACTEEKADPPAPPPATAAASSMVTSDRYDASKMDFKSPPAVLSTERHTGPFAQGSALNMTADIKPLDPATTKEIRLDTTHKIIELAPGVKFSAWT